MGDRSKVKGDLQTSTAGALRDIFADGAEDSRMADVVPGAIYSLTALLLTGSQDGKQEAAGALRNLAYGSNPRWRTVMIDAGAVGPLVSLLGEAAYEGRIFAADALARLAREGEACRKL